MVDKRTALDLAATSLEDLLLRPDWNEQERRMIRSAAVTLRGAKYAGLWEPQNAEQPGTNHDA